MPEPIRQQAIAEQAGKIADLIGTKIEDIRFDSNGIKLDYEQMDLLMLELSDRASERGFQNAIDLLRSTGESANVQGPERNLTMWAVMVSAASFLEGVK
jgi:hypothetical protein